MFLGRITLASIALLSLGCQGPPGLDQGTEATTGSLTALTDVHLVSASSCTLSFRVEWTAIPATQEHPVPPQYYVYRDGNLDVSPPWRSNFWAPQAVLPSATYRIQVAYAYGDGVMSPLSAPLDVTMPGPCRPRPEYADGVLRIATVLLRFPERTGDPPFTAATAGARMYTDADSVAAFVRESSRNAATAQGTVFGWHTFPFTMASRGCMPNAEGRAYGCHLSDADLLDAAVAAGVNPADFERLIYFVDGVAEIGLGSLMAALPPAPQPDVVAHEVLGHGLGLMHAGSWEAPNGFIQPGPSLTDLGAGGFRPNRYGDAYDPMGVSRNDFNAQSLWMLGWLADGERETAELGNRYFINKLGSAVYPTKELLLPLGGNSFYFLEYRSADGFNALPPLDADLHPPAAGVHVRLWQNSRLYNGSPILDTTTLQVTDAPLKAGGLFVDSYRDLRVRVLSAQADAALVAVSSNVLCHDGALDDSESDVDCGGACGTCAVGKHCSLAIECGKQLCQFGICRDPCIDHLKDVDESDVDCGGTICGGCGTGKICRDESDCASGLCSAGVCQAPNCSNHATDGNESDVDCGGICPTCATGKHCHVGSDCTSGQCQFGVCQ